MKLTQLDLNVIENLGYDSLVDECKGTLSDVANYSASGGYGQFCYYSDTCKFFDDNRGDILQLASEIDACMNADGAASFIKSFRCLDGLYSLDEVAQVIYDKDCDNDAVTQVKNALAWFALEETARKVSDV